MARSYGAYLLKTDDKWLNVSYLIKVATVQDVIKALEKLKLKRKDRTKGKSYYAVLKDTRSYLEGYSKIIARQESIYLGDIAEVYCINLVKLLLELESDVVLILLKDQDVSFREAKKLAGVIEK